MNFDIDSLMTNALVLVPIITAIVQAIKLSFLKEENFKWCPLIAIAIGILFAYLTSNDIDGYDHRHILGVGVFSALASSGIYSGLKATMYGNHEQHID